MFVRLPAFLNDVFAGAVGCRLEAKDGGKHDLYIMTLCVFKAYRRQGVGACGVVFLFSCVVVFVWPVWPV